MNDISLNRAMDMCAPLVDENPGLPVCPPLLTANRSKEDEAYASHVCLRLTSIPSLAEEQ